MNYKYRMHDPRIGRFFAVDPLAPKYPWYTPYQFSGNKPIQFVELEGLEEASVNTDQGTPATQEELPESQRGQKVPLYKYWDCQAKEICYLTHNQVFAVHHPVVTNLQTGDVYYGTEKYIRYDYYEKGYTDFYLKPYQPLVLANPWYNPDFYVTTPKFIFEFSGDVTAGVSAGVKYNLGGVSQFKAEGSLVDFSLVGGKYDIAQRNGDGYVIGDGSGARVKQSIDISVSVLNQDRKLGSIGLFAENKFKTHGTGAFDEETKAGVFLIAPLYQKGGESIMKSQSGTLSSGNKPKLDFSVGKQKEFYGIDASAGIKLIIGINLGLKIGIKI